jgi:hypothetical protein
VTECYKGFDNEKDPMVLRHEWLDRKFIYFHKENWNSLCLLDEMVNFTNKIAGKQY